jgi:hypothetical protein
LVYREDEMRRTLLALTLVVGLLVFPSAASATHDLLGFQSAVDAMEAVDRTLDPPPNEGRHDFVVGGFKRFGANIAVSAHSGPLGEDPFGHVSVTVTDSPIPDFGQTFQVRFKVTCLAVAANMAALGGVETEAASNDNPPGTNHVMVFRDSGLPGGAGDGFTEITGFPADNCAVWLPLAAGAGPIERGNFLVHDAQP